MILPYERMMAGRIASKLLERDENELVALIKSKIRLKAAVDEVIAVVLDSDEGQHYAALRV